MVDETDRIDCDFKLAACVILYYPDKDVLENINSYAPHCQHLYVVNNGGGESVIEQLLLIYGNERIEVISFSDNQGIARPLNIVLEKSLKHGYEFLMTMDQDTRFVNEGFKDYLREAKCHDWGNTLGISAYFDNENAEINQRFKHIEVSRVITSTNIVDIKRAKEVGAYEEKLFIDEVDFDFCYRGILKCYSFFAITDIALEHNVGKPTIRRFIWRNCSLMNHGYVRKYYITRNRLWVYNKYWNKCKIVNSRTYIVGTLLMLLKVLLYEEEKIEKARYMYLGLKDFLVGKMGKVY